MSAGWYQIGDVWVQLQRPVQGRQTSWSDDPVRPAHYLVLRWCCAPHRLLAVMSPTVVVAWMVRSVVPVFLRELLTRPMVVPASRAAEVPAAAPTVIAAVWVRSCRVPRVASVMRLLPRAVRSCASPPRRPAVM